MFTGWWVNRKGRDKASVQEWKEKWEDAEIEESRKREERGKAAASDGESKRLYYTWGS